MSNTPEDFNSQVPPVPPVGDSASQQNETSSFPPPPGPNPPLSTPTGSDIPSKDDRMYAMAMHLSLFSGLIIPFGGFIVPIVLWVIKKDKSPFIDDQGKEVINLLITSTIAFVVCAILTLLLIGFLLMIGLAIALVITIIMGAIKASEGQYYRYPYILRFIK